MPPNPAHAEITPRQQEVLSFIKDYIAEKGVAPSQTEVAAYLGVSQNSAAYSIGALVKKGALTKIKGIARGIALPKEPDNNPTA